MKKRKVSYRRINWFIFLLIATSIAAGIFIALKLWFVLIFILPLMIRYHRPTWFYHKSCQK